MRIFPYLALEAAVRDPTAPLLLRVSSFVAPVSAFNAANRRSNWRISVSLSSRDDVLRRDDIVPMLFRYFRSKENDEELFLLQPQKGKKALTKADFFPKNDDGQNEVY